jgi:hypothetical protein
MRRRWFVFPTVFALGALAACQLAFPTHESEAEPDGGDAGEGGVSACPSTCPAPGKTLVSCTGIQEPCALGCTGDPNRGARCRDLAPSGVALPSDYAETTVDVTWGPDASVVIDTGSGAITRDGTTIRAAGTGLDGPSGITFRIANQLDDSRLGTPSPALGIFGFHSLKVAQGATVQVIGTRAAALLAETDLVVDGAITARGRCDAGAPGPGGFALGTGPRPGGNGATFSCGSSGNVQTCVAAGGGAGFGTAGGSGDSNFSSQRAPGGAALPAFDGGPFAMIGGSGGGRGGASPTGGVGGGALQLAASRSILVGGSLDACGCGGSAGGGSSSGFSRNGAPGGGAGGMIVVEAPSVRLGPQAVIAANGGSGGGNGNVGGDGTVNGAQASANNGGGRGGALAGLAGNGGNDVGGGGGSVGRVILNFLSFDRLPDGGVVSPAPALGVVVGK